MPVKRVEIANIGSVKLVKRRGVRSIRLSISHDGEVRVSMPYWVPYVAAIEFAKSKGEWIVSKRIINKPISDGGLIGKTHQINFFPQQQRKSIATRITKGGEIRIYHPSNLNHADQSVQKAAEKASIRALKVQAEDCLPQRLADLSKMHGFNYRNVTIKRLKSRWGSCTDKQDIALNCFLMQLPWHLIDYVILHELTHTKVMSHGPDFWSELGQYVPNLKFIRKEIKSYRPVLLTQ